MARPMRTPTSRCVITCALDGDGAIELATRPAAKANRMRMNESPLVDGYRGRSTPRFGPLQLRIIPCAAALITRKRPLMPSTVETFALGRRHWTCAASSLYGHPTSRGGDG